MSAVAARIGPPVWPAPLIVGAAGCALLFVWGIFMPQVVLQGWLIAFVVASGPVLGAVALVCTARLTGGRWATAESPLQIRIVVAAPLLCLAFLPVIAGAGLIFPWARNPDAAGKDVAEYYLNTGFFALRGGLTLIGLSVVALLLASGRGERLLAAFGLAFYAIAVDATSFDWILSLEPRFSSSAFGAEMAVQKILSALALMLLVPGSQKEEITRDLAGLTFAAALGVLYMETMSLIINWYGDQPDHAEWYLNRSEGIWLWVGLAALALGAIGPLAALLFTKVRGSPGASRIVGASILLGVALQDLWLIAPNAARAAAPAAVLALVAMAGLLSAFSSWMRSRLVLKEPRDVD
jgi:hypothetical protein